MNMTSPEMAPPADEAGASTPATNTAVRSRLRWWKELLIVLAFYGVYTAVRNTQGSERVGVVHACTNARRILDAEAFLHIKWEQAIQDFFIDHKWFIWIWNNFYGSAHFIVTIGALVWLFRRAPQRYSRWRTTLAITTGLALFGFAFFPLAPPRLVSSTCDFGAAYHYVDTLKTIGGLWDFDSGAMQKVSNQYAAMPSLHFGWSLWCGIVLYGLARRRWARALAVAYPVLTLFTIVVTANHYILDAVGGACALGLGAAAAVALGRVVPRAVP